MIETETDKDIEEIGDKGQDPDLMTGKRRNIDIEVKVVKAGITEKRVLLLTIFR